MTRATHDTIGPEYARRWGTRSDWAQALIGRLSGMLPAGARVVDVGCGPGQHTLMLRGCGLRTVGLDLSSGMLRALAVPGLVQADMRALPLGLGSLEAIWCC